MADKQLDPFSCPVCLDTLRDPVTIPCGHNYCMSCIKDYWQKDSGKDAGYSCPQCRKSFLPRPVLNKNTMFAEVVERFRNTGLQDPPASRYGNPGRKERQNYTAQNHKTSQMCLEREDSCWKTHPRCCNSDFPREKHTIIVVSGEPRGNECCWPNRDQQRIRPPCLDEAHRRPEMMKRSEQTSTLATREHRSKDRTTGHSRKHERTHRTGHHRHRSGQTRGSHAKRKKETHPSRGHRANPHGHGHYQRHGRRRRRLGVLVMAGTGTPRKFVEKK